MRRIRTFFRTNVWPSDEAVRRGDWQLYELETYRNIAMVLVALVLLIGLLIGSLICTLSQNGVLITLWAIPVLCMASFGFVCERRVKGIIDDIDLRIAPLLRLLRRLGPQATDIILSRLEHGVTTTDDAMLEMASPELGKDKSNPAPLK